MEFLALLGILIVVGPLVLGIVSFTRTKNLVFRADRLERVVRRLDRELKILQGAAEQVVPEATPPQSAEVPPRPDVAQPEKTTAPQQPVSAAARSKVPATKERAQGAKTSWFPETLGAANWMIIGGGIALALAAGFLIKYSVEEGWLGPVARVVIGILLGIGLLVAGDVARRKSFGRGEAVLKFDAMPATLTGAGIIALFASVYGAYGLYGLLSPLVTFAALVIISLVAVVLSFSHGMVIAGLGLTGAYVVPLLVRAESPSPSLLFGYLFVVTCAAVLVGRFRLWLWASAGGLAAVVLWTLFYVAEAGMTADKDVLQVFWFGLFYLYALVPGFELAGEETVRAPSLRSPVSILTSGAGTISAVVIFSIFFANEHSVLSSTLLGGLVVSCVALAWRYDTKLTYLFIGCATAVLTLITWELILIGPDQTLSAESFDEAFIGGGPHFPPGSQSLAWVAAGIALLFTGSGVLRAALLKSRSGLWSSIGVAVALVALGTVYLRINGLEHSISWAIAAAGLSVVLLAAAALVRSRVADEGASPALAAYAVGVLASLLLGVTLVLEREWLSVSLALLIPGIAWVYTGISLPVLRKLAMIVGLVVLARLLANPFILDYEIVRPLIFNWLLYGYGVPAAAFFWAARLLRRDTNNMTSDPTSDKAVMVLEAGALVFAVVCATAQVRVFIHDGDLSSTSYLLSEASLNTLIWASFAYGLFRRAGPSQGAVVNVGTRILVYVTLIHLGVVHLLALNPYWSGEAIGQWPVINVLFLAYVLPALALSAFHLPWHRNKLSAVFGEKNAAVGIGLISVFTFILGLTYITLEVTRSFHGPVLTSGASSDGELYTYSLIWLVYAAILMGLGIWRRNHFIRMAAMTVIGLVGVKVLLVDTANLEGLLRVFSFVGLAVSLLGIGYFYQRFVVVEAVNGDEVKSAGAD